MIGRVHQTIQIADTDLYIEAQGANSVELTIINKSATSGVLTFTNRVASADGVDVEDKVFAEPNTLTVGENAQIRICAAFDQLHINQSTAIDAEIELVMDFKRT